MTSSDSHKTATPRIKPVKPGALRAVDEGVFVEGEDDLEAVESCDDSRIGSWEVCDAIWRSVHFSGCKIGYLNLRDAEVSDLKFTNCVIEELDLMRAKASRVAFTDCRIGRLELAGSRLADVDLRGAQLTDVGDLAGLSGVTVSLEQLLDLAPLMAARLGVTVE